MNIIREPVYLQIQAVLRSEIDQGTYPEGARFLSEREIALRFQVSRPTANKILSTLVADGCLEQRRGVGTFIRPRLLDHDLGHLVSFTDQAAIRGLEPKSQILEFCKVKHPILGKARFIARLRFAGQEPVILEQRWLPLPLFKELDQNMAEHSIYQAITAIIGSPIVRADQTVRAVIPDLREKTLLQLTVPTASFRIQGRGYDADSRLLWIEETLYRGDKYEITASIGK